MNTETYISLTALGEIYGVNARDVGSWLKGLNLRLPDGRPSREAVEQGLVCAILDGMCYKRAEQQAGEQHDGFVLIRGG